MNDQITIVCLIKARPETIDTVKEKLIHLTKMTRQEEGNLNYDLHVCDTDSSLFIIHENWENAAALDRHKQQSHLTDFIAAQDELLEYPIDIKVCKMVDV